MTGSSKNTVDFRFDATNKVVVARPNWNIRTESDCQAWYRQFEDYFTSLKLGPVDFIVILDDFILDRKITTVWGTYRAKMIRNFTRYSVRVNASLVASTAAHTSSALHGGASDEAPDLASALDRIRQWREQDSTHKKNR